MSLSCDERSDAYDRAHRCVYCGTHDDGVCVRAMQWHRVRGRVESTTSLDVELCGACFEFAREIEVEPLFGSNSFDAIDNLCCLLDTVSGIIATTAPPPPPPLSNAADTFQSK